ncbi:MAG: SRPBCC family protein [Chloroflexi bacterium]|nr:SRPBCC family protein [Chloroflexota bacterium]
MPNIETSIVIDRQPSVVFQFAAAEHATNHPRWDPEMRLEPVTEGPLRIGSVLKRYNSRSGQEIEGTMEVEEWVQDKSFGMLIHDGPMEMHGRLAFESVGTDSTKVTMTVDIVGMPNPLDPMPVHRTMENMKRLIESER